MSEPRPIRIWFEGFWPSCDFAQLDLYRAMQERGFLPVLDAEDPDFLVYSCFSVPEKYLQYDCVRILFCGENYSPDFNLCDYSLSYDPLRYPGRHLRYLDGYGSEYARCLTDAPRRWSPAFLAQKTRFCNFIYSHPSQANMRELLLDALSAYKPVDCAGSFRNNQPGGQVADTYEKKLAFQQSCKFTIAGESTAQPGFLTEKLIHAFAAGTIPVYFGDENAAKEFNPEAFIQVRGPQDIDAAVQRVIALDKDDDAYREMLSRPVCLPGRDLYAEYHRQLCDFVEYIFSQPPQQAFRRSRCYSPKAYEDFLLERRQLALVHSELQSVLSSTSYRLGKKIVGAASVLRRKG